METILKKVYNLETLSKRQLEVVRGYLATSDFILIEDSYKTIPRKIFTTKGILNLVDDVETESNKKSDITENYAYCMKNLYKEWYNLSGLSYDRYKLSVILFLLTNKNILINFLNKKYNLNLTIKDVSKNNILENSEHLKEVKILKNKKNNQKEKEDIYIKLNRKTLLYRNNKIYLLEEKNGKRRNASQFQFRRNGLLYQNESNIRHANDV